jgi:predicted GNAT family acetyltransferase
VPPEPGLALLDNPIYHALGHAHAPIAVGNESARRYPHAIGPLAGIREPSPECIAALPALVEPGDAIVLFLDSPISDAAISVPPGLTLVREGSLDQMLCPIDSTEATQALARPLPDGVILRQLVPADYPAMVDLAHLTEPGPFRERTAELGTFFGILASERLLAMAGERTRVPGFTEVSGVCTHPDARGCGYAHTLIARVHQQIRSRDDVPYLHSWSSNASAIAVYQRLGYSLRRTFHLQAFRRDR